MYCNNCGTQIPMDGRFCIRCGLPAESAENQVDAPALNQIQPQAPVEPHNHMHTPVPPYAQQMPYGYAPMKKKRKKLLLMALALSTVALGLAAILIFGVWTERAWPLSGNTLQTRFVNESVKVLSDGLNALSYGEFDQIYEKPFVINAKYDYTSGYSTDINSLRINAAYDEQTLGIVFTQESDQLQASLKLLLLSDILYAQTEYQSDYFDESMTHGVQFFSDSDLSQPMSLTSRLHALFADSDIDFKVLAEMLFNSISEDLFDKDAERTILRMSGDEIAQTLKTFSDKLRDEKNINKQFRDYMSRATGSPLDLSNLVSLITPQFIGSDIVLVWIVRYNDAEPNHVDITLLDNNAIVFGFLFQLTGEEYSHNVYSKLTTQSYGGENDVLWVEAGVSEKKSGLNMAGRIGFNKDMIDFYMQEDWSDNRFSGNIELVASEGDPVFIYYEGDLTIGTPDTAVRRDEKYQVDTRNAAVLLFKEIFGTVLS